MTESYLQYWGLKLHPFLMAPDSKMMYVVGQYYECMERLKYAISANKGGALLISEDAGLGKTTILMRLIDEMRSEYGDSFRHALIDHPTLTDSQILASITGAITGETPSEDKFKNLVMLREALVEIQKQGGKSVIVVDEGQMLCDAKSILQELRVLINLTHENQYLHTFILSGQRPLWNTIKGMPEFWQRLPVRYYLVPLGMEETKGLVRHRLKIAGAKDENEIFTDDALEIVHRYTQGLPRIIVALADLSLLVGFTNRVKKVGFKEVSKAMNAMSGKGETLPYVRRDEKREERGRKVMRAPAPTAAGTGTSPEPGPPAGAGEGVERAPAGTTGKDDRTPAATGESDVREKPVSPVVPGKGKPHRSTRKRQVAGSVVDPERVAAVLLGAKRFLSSHARIVVPVILLAGALGYYVAFASMFGGGPGTQKPVGEMGRQENRAPGDLARKPVATARNTQAQVPGADNPAPGGSAAQHPAPGTTKEAAGEVPREAAKEAPKEASGERGREDEGKDPAMRDGVVSVDKANIREKPDIESAIIAIVDKGIKVRIEDERTDAEGSKWYKVLLKGKRAGWMSHKVLIVLRAGEIIYWERRDTL